jgi:hypothetical protein
MTEHPCTCHPDDNPPVPCTRQYAYSECVQVALQLRIKELEAVIEIMKFRHADELKKQAAQFNQQLEDMSNYPEYIDAAQKRERTRRMG